MKNDNKYYKLMLATYVVQADGDPEVIKDLIKADIEMYAQHEMYEDCARLKKILKDFE